MASPQGRPFALSSADDQQAPLWILSLLSMIYSVLIFGLRMTVKSHFTGADDVALGIAYLLGVAQWVVMYIALRVGLGKAAYLVSEEAIHKIGQLVFASRILLLLSVAFTKCSVFLFIQQLFTRENRKAWRVCSIGAWVTVAWAFTSPLIVSIGCTPSRTVDSDPGTYCAGNIARWRAVTVLDSLLEGALVVAPIILFSRVRMRWRKKITVFIVFAFRLVDIILIAVYVTSYRSFFSHGRSNIGIVKTLVWQEVLLCSALVSATIPVMKGFIGRFTTADLVAIDQSGSGLRSHQNSSTAPYGDSYAMRSLNRPERRSHSSKEEGDTIMLRPETNGEITMDIYHDKHPREDDSIGSIGSDQMGIYRKVDWHVSRNPA